MVEKVVTRAGRVNRGRLSAHRGGVVSGLQGER